MNTKFKRVLVAGSITASLLTGIPVLAQYDQEREVRIEMIRNDENQPSGIRARLVNFFNKGDERDIRPIEKRMESGKMMYGMRNFGGTVSSVSGSTFTIDSRGPGLGFGRENPKWDDVRGNWDDQGQRWDTKKATTTISVTTSSETVFKKRGGATTTISDIAIGSTVMVSGQFSTSTKTLSAKKVDIVTLPQGFEKRFATGTPMMNASTTKREISSKMRERIQSLIEKLTKLLGN